MPSISLQDIENLSVPVWEQLFDTRDFEVLLCPAAMPDMTSRLFGSPAAAIAVAVCDDAFLDFRNLVNGDGKPVENSKEMRLRLYRTPAIGQAINNTLQLLNNKLVEGEEDGASD